MTNFQTRFSRNGRNVTCSTLALGASIDVEHANDPTNRRYGMSRLAQL